MLHLRLERDSRCGRSDTSTQSLATYSRAQDREIHSVGSCQYSSCTVQEESFVESPHKVSGLMIANHTSIANLFERGMRQYDRLRKRGAFIKNYTENESFNFEEANLMIATVVKGLIDEYRASQRADYVEWGSEENKSSSNVSGVSDSRMRSDVSSKISV